MNSTPAFSRRILFGACRCIVIVLGLWVFSSVAAAEQFGDFRYGVFDEEVQIYQYTGPGGDVVIPEEIDGFPVRILDRDVFKDVTGLTSVVIATNITAIYNHAFSGCSGLTTVSLSANLENLREGTFAHCTSLTNISMSPDNPFYESRNGILYDKAGTTLLHFPCGIGGSVSIPEGVTCIGDSAFMGATALTNINFPESLGDIGPSSFVSCNGLVNVFIPAGVSNLTAGAFGKCVTLTSIEVAESNAVYSSSSGILFNKSHTRLIEYPAGLSGTYAAPSTTTHIAASAFSGCAGLTAVTLPDSITGIGSFAFSGCTGLTTVTLPDRITAIESGTFIRCSGLTNIVFNAGITNIGSSAFYGCSGLERIQFPDSVTRLAWGALSYCSALTNIVLGTGITIIESRVFYECHNLQNLYLPESVTDLWYSAFNYCYGLTNITVATNNSTYSSIDGVVFDKGQSSLLHFPLGVQGRYVVPEGTQFIGDYAFDNCGNLSCVELPADCISLGRYAFAHTTHLTGLCFAGAPPRLGTQSFLFSDQVVIYYRAENAAQWDTTFADRPTAIWPELVSATVQAAGFVFDVLASDGQNVVIEMCPGLSIDEWAPVFTQTVSGSSLEVTIPDWETDAFRAYRMSIP